MKEGTVLIVPTGQSGTLTHLGDPCTVLLRNGDVWTGSLKQCREPQSQEDLDACPLDIDRLERKPKKRNPYEVI